MAPMFTTRTTSVLNAASAALLAALLAAPACAPPERQRGQEGG
jgi:hypothetical protein